MTGPVKALISNAIPWTTAALFQSKQRVPCHYCKNISVVQNQPAPGISNISHYKTQIYSVHTTTTLGMTGPHKGKKNICIKASYIVYHYAI